MLNNFLKYIINTILLSLWIDKQVDQRNITKKKHANFKAPDLGKTNKKQQKLESGKL